MSAVGNVQQFVNRMQQAPDDPSPPERKDSRHLFRGVTTRKPTSWNGVNSFRPGIAQEESLRTMPVRRIGMGYTGPYNRFPNLAEEEVFLMDNGRAFYVNSEGFPYARYVAEITGGLAFLEEEEEEVPTGALQV